MKTIGSRIKNLRLEHNLSIQQLAEIVGKSKGNISGYENDKFEPSAQTIIAIAEYFSVSTDWILKGEKFQNQNSSSIKKSSFSENSIPSLSKESKKDLEKFISFLQYKEQEIAKKQAENIKETSPNYPTNTISISEHIKEETRLDINEEDQEPKKELRILGYTAAGEPIDMPDDIYGLGDVIKVPADIKADFALTVKGDSMEPRIPNESVVYVKKQDTVDNGQIAIVSINNTVTCKIFKQKNDIIYLHSINPNYNPIVIDNEDIDFKIIGKVIDQK